MSAEHKDPKRSPYEALFPHFKRHKVVISNAIKKPFPFLELLHDTELITKKMYDDLKDSCTNLVPIQQVVYRALEELEKRFDQVVLKVLFDPENMKAYPDLKPILKSFENVLQNKLCSQGSDRGDPNSQLSLEQGPGDSCSEESLTWSPSDPSSSDDWRSNDRRNITLIQENQTENHQSSSPQTDNAVSLLENGLSEDLDETVQINRVRRETTGVNTDEPERHQATILQDSESCELEVKLNNRQEELEPHSPLPQNEERSVLLNHGIQISSCSVHLVNIKKENSSFFLDGEQTQARTNHNQASEIIVISSDDSDDENNSPEAPTSVICQSKPLESRKPRTSRKTNKRRDISDADSSSTGKRYRWLRRVYSSSSSELSAGEESQEYLRSGSAHLSMKHSAGPCSGHSLVSPPFLSLSFSSPLMNPNLLNEYRKRVRGMQPLDTQEVENNSTSRKDVGKIRKKRDRHGKYSIRNIKMPSITTWRKAFPMRRINSSSQRGRKRGRRIPRQKNVDFNSSELPVTCGNAKGTLYKEKYKQGIHEKSIQSGTGQWLTPRQFEIKGNREKSKNWRQSIRCYGWTLKELIKKKHLPDSPRKRRKKENPPNPQRTKKKLENSKQCTVCRQGRKLHRCAICRKFYHRKCHIPPVEDKSGPWSCVFCKIKDQLRCQENQACYKESEVLKRKMLPEEQLKCELLLLTMYCHSKSGFFICKPKQRKEDFPELQEHMWLNKIKYRLNKKAYRSVQHFVEDMRRIFQNHSIIYKNSKFNNLGVTVGSLFEETFKTTFSINDTSKQLQHVVLLT